MTPKDLRGKIAIVGAAESNEIGRRPDASALTLNAEAAKNALDDMLPNPRHSGESRNPEDS